MLTLSFCHFGLLLILSAFVRVMCSTLNCLYDTNTLSLPTLPIVHVSLELDIIIIVIIMLIPMFSPYFTI